MSDTMPEAGTEAHEPYGDGTEQPPQEPGADAPEHPEHPAARAPEDPERPGPDTPAHDPAEPHPLGVPRTATGEAEVDVPLERLADVDHLPTDGHIEVYEDVHRGLRDALTALDARPGPPAPAPARPYDTRS